MYGSFADPLTLIGGALAGFIFGVLLQRGGLTRYDVIAGQFALRDNTVIKTMVTAIVVGSIGLFAVKGVGVDAPLHIKPANILGIILGGTLFGAGMALLGYCPGTCVAAVGEGRRDAVAGLLGMAFGAAVYAEVHPWAAENILDVWSFGRLTLFEASGVSVWVFALLFGAISVAGLRWLERFERRGG